MQLLSLCLAECEWIGILKRGSGALENRIRIDIQIVRLLLLPLLFQCLIKMVGESLPSPGYRRSTSSPFKRSLSSPDISWRSLAHRHKFLLYTLGLLTLLCTVYLYFAITWGASDSCSGLGGTQRALCQLRGNKLNSDSLKAHHRRLLYVDDSDDPPKKVSFGGRLKEFEAFFSSGSSEDLKEIEITRLRGTINGLRRVIRSLRRGNARLRKTVTILRSDYHTPSTEEDNNNKQAIPVPPRGPRLRGDI